MFIAVSGIGVLAYTLTSLTALVVEGELTKSFGRREEWRKWPAIMKSIILCVV